MLFLVALLFALGGSIWADASSDWWDSLPVVSNLATSILLLLFTLLLVDEYVKWRAAEAWKSVAAFALEDLARVARAVWVKQATTIDPPLQNVRVVPYTRSLLSPQGRKVQEEELDLVMSDARRREKLFAEIREAARRTRELIIAWSPSLLPHAPLAPYLAEVATLHRTMVQILRVMEIAQKGEPLPVPREQLQRWIMDVTYLAIALDERLHQEAGQTDPLNEYGFVGGDY